MIFIKILKDKQRKILVVFDDMIADMLSNKKLQQKVVGYRVIWRTYL